MSDPWIDVAPHPAGGFVKAQSLSGAVRVTFAGGASHDWPVPTDFLRWLRVAVSPAGQVAVIGQAGDGLALLIVNGAVWSLGQTFGMAPVALRYEGETLHTYRCGPGDFVPLYLDGVETLRTHAVEGIRDVLPDGTIILGQPTAAGVFDGHNFGQFTRRDGWIVGQSGFTIGCLHEATSHYFTARRGTMSEGIHVARQSTGELAVCALTEAGAFYQVFSPPFPPNEPLVVKPPPVKPPPPPPPLEDSVPLPPEVKSIRSRYVAAFPVPQGDKGAAHEERCRQWSIRFAEQVAYEIPDQGYGVKRASPSRPISKDTLARWAPPGRLLMWDLLSGAGTGKPTLVTDPKSEDVTGQTFVAVTPTNHLGSVVDPPPPPDDDLPPPRPAGPSLDVWLHQELPKLVAEFKRKRPELGEPGWEWISFTTYRRFVEGWSYARVFAEV